MKSEILTTIMSVENEFMDRIKERDSEPEARALLQAMVFKSGSALRLFLDFLTNSDDTYVWYGYDQKKAWHLAARLGGSVFAELAKSRKGKSNSFEFASKSTSNQSTKYHRAGVVLFATVKTIEKMEEFVDSKFFHHPIVAMEFTQHLLETDSSVQIKAVDQKLDRFIEKFEKLKTEIVKPNLETTT